MTSPSRKKHQITASVVRRRTSPDRLVSKTFGGIATVALMFAAVSANAQDQRVRQHQAQKFYRPGSSVQQDAQRAPQRATQRYAPPVHAQPLPQGNRQRNLRHHQHTQQARQRANQTQQRRYPVRQTGWQELGDQPQSAQFQPPGFQSESADQWRTRTQEAVQEADDFLRSASERMQGTHPQLQHPSPQQSATRDWGTQRYSDVAMPDTEIPPMQRGNQLQEQNHNLPVPRLPQQGSQFGQSNGQINSLNQAQSDSFNSTAQTPPQATQEKSYTDPFVDAPPAMENYENNPFAESNSANQTFDTPSPAGQSVLVKDHPLRDNIMQAADDTDNSLRDLRIEPRRLRDSRPGRRKALQSNYRRPLRANRNYQEEDEYSIDDDQMEDILDDEDDETDQGRGLKSCEEFRAELLNNPITDIILDISPSRPSTAAQDIPFGLTRTWTDCDGNALGTGTLIGMERSYIVITNETGASQLISRTRLGDNDLAVVSEFWALPTECSLGCYPFEGRHWAPNSFYWKASALCHKPLYFENRQLERYGHSHGPIMQPIHSTAHFFTSLLLYPYNTGINPPNECLYALGFYRPGDCAPWLKDPFPISMQGAKRQGALIGLGFAVLP